MMEYIAFCLVILWYLVLIFIGAYLAHKFDRGWSATWIDMPMYLSVICLFVLIAWIGTSWILYLTGAGDMSCIS